MPAMKRALLLLLLAACAAPRPVAAPGVRDLSRPVYSIAGFDAARLAGDWHQVAGFSATCHGGTLEVTGTLAYDLCLPSGRSAAEAAPTGTPGRFQSGDGALWVLWADADDRTLVIGGPDGRIGAILNRSGDISADRMKAARDILSFNGYDTSRLVTY